MLKKFKNMMHEVSPPVSAPVALRHYVQILHLLPPVPSVSPSTAQQCKPAPCVRQQPFPLLLAVRTKHSPRGI